eukprot:CAMPEP_0113848000 /NCGR_PEP_ID=MMETSP0372-20130328/2209_1 /TAXON_ID=340204 /ORGANISM="Lankesteria abbotti" /LENGTH=721 /DNA_ID=CAMNT_0000817385 /DNA_START=159 /DNA_END=2324 /DNA_ORIENTATION=+ /assembly_acc=CAM_ASM_000359
MAEQSVWTGWEDNAVAVVMSSSDKIENEANDFGNTTPHVIDLASQSKFGRPTCDTELPERIDSQRFPLSEYPHDVFTDGESKLLFILEFVFGKFAKFRNLFRASAKLCNSAVDLPVVFVRLVTRGANFILASEFRHSKHPSGCHDNSGNVTGGVDTGVIDTGGVDTGVVDTGVVDTGVVDTGGVDTGVGTGGVGTSVVGTGGSSNSPKKESTDTPATKPMTLPTSLHPTPTFVQNGQPRAVPELLTILSRTRTTQHTTPYLRNSNNTGTDNTGTDNTGEPYKTASDLCVATSSFCGNISCATLSSRDIDAGDIDNHEKSASYTNDNHEKSASYTNDNHEKCASPISGCGGSPHLEVARHVLPLVDENVANGSAGIVVIVPGLTSSSTDISVRSASLEALRAGYSVVVVNHRGTGRTPVTSSSLFCAGSTDDFKLAIDTIHGRYPHLPICCIGVSMGANILVKYLGEKRPGSGPGRPQQPDSPAMSSSVSEASTTSTSSTSEELPPVAVAVAMSTPIDLLSAASSSSKSCCGLYSLFFSRKARNLAKVHFGSCHPDCDKGDDCVLTGTGSMSPPKGICMDATMRVKRMLQVDEVFTRRAFGYSSLAEYYDLNSSKHYLSGVRTPLLMLHAENDPICPYDCLDLFTPLRNPYVAIATTASGGHCAFFTGSLKCPKFWGSALAIQFISASQDPRVHSVPIFNTDKTSTTQLAYGSQPKSIPAAA